MRRSCVPRRYDDIFAKLGGDVEAARAMGPLLSRIGSNFVTAEAGAELEAVFAAHACVPRTLPHVLTVERSPSDGWSDL